MSLLLEAMEDCTIIDKKTQPDGRGGVITTWEDGAEIKAAIVLDTSMQARVAEAQGVKALYTITTAKSVLLQYHDVLRRERDGKVFRCTSDGDDKATPASAVLNMRQVTAEEYTLNG
jgi:hypothetical protein